MAYEINPILDRLCAAFPACFSRTAPQPLKISLGDEVLALAGVHPALADLSRTQVRRALKVYTGSPAYRKALVQRPANGLDNLYQEWFADIRPAKRLGQGLVKEGDERQNPAFEFFG